MNFLSNVSVESTVIQSDYASPNVSYANKQLARQQAGPASGAVEPFYFVDNPISVAADVVSQVEGGEYAAAAFTLATLGKGNKVKKVASIGKIQSLQGKSVKWLQRNKPRGWRQVPADRGSGWKWIDESGNERLRFMRSTGQSPVNSKWSRQSNGYFRWQNEKGDFLDIDGNIVPLQDPDFAWKTHLPYEGL